MHLIYTVLAAHHYYIAICFILVGCVLRPSMKVSKVEYLIVSEVSGLAI